MIDEAKKTDGQHNVAFFRALNALPETLRPLLSAFESQIKAIAVAAFTRGFDAGHQAAKDEAAKADAKG